MISESDITLLPIKALSKQQTNILTIMGLVNKIVSYGYTNNKTKQYFVSFNCENCGKIMWRNMSVLQKCKTLTCKSCLMRQIRLGHKIDCINEHKKTQTLHRKNSLAYLSVNKDFFDLFKVRLDDCQTTMDGVRRFVLLVCPSCKNTFYKKIYYMTSIKSHGGLRDYCCSKKCAGKVLSGEVATSKKPIFATLV